MSEIRPWEWDWPSIVALSASIVALVGVALTSYFSWLSIRTLKAIELAKFKEKWLVDLQGEMAGFCAILLGEEFGHEERVKVSVHFHKILLSIGSDEALAKNLSERMAAVLVKKEQGEPIAEDLFVVREKFLNIRNIQWQETLEEISKNATS